MIRLKTFLLLLFFICNFSNINASESICADFYDSIKTNGRNLSLHNPPIIKDENKYFGFELYMHYNEDVEDYWENTKIDGQYFKVFNTLYGSEADQVLFPNDLIYKINDSFVKDLTDSDYWKLTEDNNTLNISLLREKNNEKIDITKTLSKSKVPETVTVYPVFRIKSFNDFNIKDSQYKIHYELSYYWEDPRLTDLIKKFFIEQEGPIDEQIKKAKKDHIPSIGWLCDVFTGDDLKMLDRFLWFSEIEFINLVMDDLQNKIREVSFEYNIFAEDVESYKEGDERLFITIRERGIATFSSIFNFAAFPFDSHKIEFIYSDVQTSKSQLIVDYDYYGNTPIKKNLSGKLSAWNIPETMANIESYEYVDTYEYVYDGLKSFFTIDRNSTYYIFKILAPIFLILIICWSIFWLHIKEIESRLTVSIVCLLTLIAYNFVIDDSLPKLPYLTIMDKIILLSYIYAAIPTLISVYASSLHSKQNIEYVQIDNYCKFIGPISYFMIIIVILYYDIHNNPSASAYLRQLF